MIGHESAIDLYLRGLEVEEVAEELYQGLITCYLVIGKISEGLSAYERCRESLSASLNVKPSQATEDLRDRLRQ